MNGNNSTDLANGSQNKEKRLVGSKASWTSGRMLSSSSWWRTCLGAQEASSSPRMDGMKKRREGNFRSPSKSPWAATYIATPTTKGLEWISFTARKRQLEPGDLLGREKQHRHSRTTPGVLVWELQWPGRQRNQGKVEFYDEKGKKLV